MKKIFSLIFILSFGLLVGCTTSENTPINQTVSLSSDQSLVLSTYLASGLMPSSTNDTTNLSAVYESQYKMSLLSTNENTLEIESELDEVNIYFDKLKVFMDEGIESVLNISEQTSTMEGYDTEITYAIEDVTYTIYYSFIDELTEKDVVPTSNNTDNEDDDEVELDEEQEFKLEGLMIIDGIEYQLTGANEIEDDEQKMWFKTIDTNNTGNEVKVVIKNENEEQKFEINTKIDGVEKMSKIKFEKEDNETKVELKFQNGDQESSYKFKKEIEDDKTVYKFEYEVDGVDGEVKIFEITDELGNVTYKYQIDEDGKTKDIEKNDRDDGEEEEEDDDDGESQI